MGKILALWFTAVAVLPESWDNPHHIADNLGQIKRTLFEFLWALLELVSDILARSLLLPPLKPLVALVLVLLLWVRQESDRFDKLCESKKREMLSNRGKKLFSL